MIIQLQQAVCKHSKLKFSEETLLFFPCTDLVIWDNVPHIIIKSIVEFCLLLELWIRFSPVLWCLVLSSSAKETHLKWVDKESVGMAIS